MGQNYAKTMEITKGEFRVHFFFIMSHLRCQLSCDIPVNGNTFVQMLTFDSKQVSQYEEELQTMLDNMLKLAKPKNIQVWRQLLKTAEDSLLGTYRFWLSQMFTPLSREKTLPKKASCYCQEKYIRGCTLDFFKHTHYDDGGEQWRVILTGEYPIFSFNCAARSARQVRAMLCYYKRCVTQHLTQPESKCCPVSLSLIKNCETLVTVTNRIFTVSARVDIGSAAHSYCLIQ